MAEKRGPNAAQVAVLVFILCWGYGYILSHLSMGWVLFSFVPLAAGAVAFIAGGGLGDA